MADSMASTSTTVGDWAKDHLTTLEYLRTKTYSDTTQTITF